MQILLHVCCGPCAVYPFRRLLNAGHTVCGLFYNPNIHPYQEFRRRLEAVQQLAAGMNYAINQVEDYNLDAYLRQVVFYEQNRCRLCYGLRLQHTAEQAVAQGFEAFSSTLLYSRYQNHQAIVAVGAALAAQYGLHFYAEDFRLGWQEGVDESIRLGLYRQPYCGCIYSEQERYDKRLREQKKKAKLQSCPQSKAFIRRI